ncbi:MAG: hypothetical protein U1E23_09645 [Reyranellaceae bacterium]
MTAKTTTLFIPRRVAALYLAWEVGLARANVLIKTLPRDHRGWVEMTAPAMRLMFVPARGRVTRRHIDAYAARIREAVAYQEGRLGRGLTAGGGCVRAA